MRDAQRGGMQRGARENDHVRVGATGKQIASQDRARFPVERIDQQRMSERGEVHADLVRASGLNRNPAQRDAAQVPGRV